MVSKVGNSIHEFYLSGILLLENEYTFKGQLKIEGTAGWAQTVRSKWNIWRPYALDPDLSIDSSLKIDAEKWIQ